MKSQSLLLLSLFAFAACAGQTYRAEAGPMFARARGEIALANSSGFLPPGNDISGNLGLGETEASPFIRLSTDIDRHRVRLHGFYLDGEGTGTLANGQAYGNIAGPTQVQMSMDFFAIASSWCYELMREENYRIAAGAAVGFYSLDVAARSAGGREEVTSEVVVPMPYGEAEFYWKDFTLGANVGVMAGDLGDANGRYWDLEAYGSWQADPRFDVKVGYRYLLLDGYGRASSRDFDADVDVQGFFISGGIRF